MSLTLSSATSKSKKSSTIRQNRRAHNEDEFLWLISLSDLMILLFIFFVVLFAFTREKIRQTDLQRIAATLTNNKNLDPAEKIKTDLEQWAASTDVLHSQVSVQRTSDGIELQMKDSILFAKSEYIPMPQIQPVLRELSKLLESLPKSFRIGIEGHTDDLPIHTATIGDNWDLSTKRAWGMLQALHLSPALESRVVLMGYGAMKPIAANRDAQGNPIPGNQSKNRRVTIRIF